MVKHIYIVLFFFGLNQTFAQDKSLNIKLLDHWQNPNLPRINGTQIWSDLTGYVDTIQKREYIIAGSTDSIYFFDITNPQNIVLCDVEDGKSKQMVNRDFECFSHYVYCVSDNKQLGSLQVFDLSFLPDSVHKVYDSDTIAHNTHSIFIDAKSKRLYMCINRTRYGVTNAMDVISLENPELPIKISSLNVPKFNGNIEAFKNVHEVFVRNDTAWCSTEYTGLWVFDLRDLNKQALLTVIANYPENGYNHSSWLSPNGKHIMFTDEVPNGLAIKIFDVSNIYDPKMVSKFESSIKATAHNAFWIGDFAYVSYYHDGVVIFDLKNPFNPVQVGYYRTFPFPPASYEGFNGCWGLYPWFPSGTIAASDMQEGIFTLKPSAEITGLSVHLQPSQVNIFPNPATNSFQINFSFEPKENPIIAIYNSLGELVLQKPLSQPTFETSIENWLPGFYVVNIKSGNQIIKKKLIKL